MLRMPEEEFKLSRARLSAYEASVSNSVVALTTNEVLLSVARSKELEGAIKRGLTAQRVVVTSQGVATVTDADGNQVPITEPDHATQLEAVRTHGNLLKANQPTGPAVQVNTAINNSNTQNNINVGGRSFEARRRAAAERRGVVDGGVAVAEAEVVEESDEALDGEDVEVELDNPDEVDDPIEDEEE
jgi:hypothetical protein